MEHRFPPEAFTDAQELFLPSDIGIAPLSAVARALRGFNREQLSSAIEVLIAMLDIADGDPDAEADDRGGETIAIVADPNLPPEDAEPDPDLEETGAEDSFVVHAGASPGCPISDPGGAGDGEDDEADGTDEGDPAYAEWHTLAGPQRRAGKINSDRTGDWCQLLDEDAEDDDPDHGQDDGEPQFIAVRGEGAGCSISDPDYACDDVCCDEEHQDMEQEQMHHDVPMLPVYSLEHNIFNDQRVPLGISNLMSSFVGRNVRSADTGELHTTMPATTRKPGEPV